MCILHIKIVGLNIGLSLARRLGPRLIVFLSVSSDVTEGSNNHSIDEPEREHIREEP